MSSTFRVRAARFRFSSFTRAPVKKKSHKLKTVADPTWWIVGIKTYVDKSVRFICVLIGLYLNRGIHNRQLFIVSLSILIKQCNAKKSKFIVLLSKIIYIYKYTINSTCFVLGPISITRTYHFKRKVIGKKYKEVLN